MTRLAVSMEVPPERAARYRAEGLWDAVGLTDGIEAEAARRPDALALADNEHRLSHAELSRAVANGVATLATHGVGLGDGVVLVAGNTVHPVVAYHALLRVGATTLVLDRRCGAADVRHALDVLPGTVRIVASAVERQRLIEGLEGLEGLDRPDGATPTAWLQLEAFGDTAPRTPGVDDAEPDRDAPAVVLFTSGTTGRPKGVIHSLNTLTAGAANMARITGADETSVLFLVSPVTSITGIMQMHLAADRHAALVLEDRFDRTPRSTGSSGRAPRFSAVRRSSPSGCCGAEARRRGDGLALRTLALGGAMLPPPAARAGDRRFRHRDRPGLRLVGGAQLQRAAARRDRGAATRRRRRAHAGQPRCASVQANTRRKDCYVDPAVFLGYVDPDDNAGAFEGDWFRTGDLVELHADRLTVVGRIKDVVNRNGLKISLERDRRRADRPPRRDRACVVWPARRVDRGAPCGGGRRCARGRRCRHARRHHVPPRRPGDRAATCPRSSSCGTGRSLGRRRGRSSVPGS